MRFMPRRGWLLDVEIAYDDDGEYYVTGIVVRWGPHLTDGTKQDPGSTGYLRTRGAKRCARPADDIPAWRLRS